MINCKELNRDFETKDEMFKALLSAKDQIISAKKSVILKSCEKGGGVPIFNIDMSKVSEAEKGKLTDPDYYYVAVNTTLILDSHKDVHLNGNWNKSAKEQSGRNYLVLDHMFGVSTTAVKKEHIEIFVAKLPFAALGYSYTGDTEALVYKFKKDKVINATAKEWLDSGDSIEASVRMQYIDLVFCANSEDPDAKAEKKAFDKYYPMIANKDDFEEEVMYFWAVKQAKNVSESSLVLAGSNHVTGVIPIQTQGQKTAEPDKSTQQNINEPSSDTQQKGVIDFLTKLKEIL